MKYLLLMYASESETSKFTPEDMQAIQKEWGGFLKEAQTSGTLLANEGLAPNTSATTVRVRNGKTLTTDGPFAETHEQLAGISVFECNDLDEAIRWATKIPTVKYGSIEVRPLWSPR
jgi:hypothetical protein